MRFYCFGNFQEISDENFTIARTCFKNRRYATNSWGSSFSFSNLMEIWLEV
jgi:hypothetical protein